MIKSMTGFGRGHARLRNGTVTVEIRTVNHKFFDITLKLPESIAQFEDRIKELLQKKIRRGKINLNISYDGSIARNERVTVNEKLARDYHNALSRVKKAVGLNGDVGIKEIVSFPGVINVNITERAFLELWPKVRRALEEALIKLIAEREQEGRSIFKDLRKRALRVDRMTSAIKERAHLNVEEYRKKFADKIKDLASGREIDMGRLEMEVAIYAKNSDISEEIVRLKNHLVNFRKTISENGEVGKKLDFIAQELHREINTIGSKASDFKISKNVIEVKSEVEKIREQVKNLE